jgi:hypothetical protein
MWMRSCPDERLARPSPAVTNSSDLENSQTKRTRQSIFEEIMELGKRSFSRFNEFQHNVARKRGHNWRCRSGSRYLYICELGLVHWCSQLRGYPGIPLTQYTPEMRHREYSTEKFCAPRCTVSCVQQVGILDNWRDPQNLKPMPMDPAPQEQELVQIGSAGEIQ